METSIEKRMKEAIFASAPNQTARYNLLSKKTKIARHKWVNWLNSRQSLSIEMLQEYLIALPEQAVWITTGQGIHPELNKHQINEVILERNSEGNAISNIPHLISQREKGTPPNYEFGYVGTGPKELAMNILYQFNVPEQEAKYFARHFAEDILSKVQKTGEVIPASDIQKWIKDKAKEIEQKTEERRTLQMLQTKHEDELKSAMQKFDPNNKK